MKSTTNVPRPLVFGEVLYDLFPDGSQVLGGAPFNVAWSLHALGARPLLVSRVGRDALGSSVRTAMEDWGMDTSGLQEDRIHPTGRVVVKLGADGPGFEIAQDQAYDFIQGFPVPRGEDLALLYHGSLALRSDASRTSFRQLRDESGVPTFVDVNLRDPWWNTEILREILASAAEIKISEEELRTLSSSGVADLESLLVGRVGRRVYVTRGKRGASLHTADESWAIEPPSGVTVVDTVGAGDAFAAVAILGQIRDWQPEETLRRAQEFASGVVGLRGATTTNRTFYESFSDTWSHE